MDFPKPIPLTSNDYDFDDEEKIKLIIIGNSGVGKTGALVALLVAGYHLWIYDFERGAYIIRNIIRDKNHDPSILSRLHVIDLSNDFKEFGGKVQPYLEGWSKFNSALSSWKSERKAGDPYFLYTLTSRDVVVFDSLTGLADLCKDHVLIMNKQLDSGERIQDYKQEQALMEFILRSVTCKKMKAHFILNCHIAEYGEGGKKVDNPKDPLTNPKVRVGGTTTGFPRSTGETLSKSLGRHFNSVLLLRDNQTAKGWEKIFDTKAEGIIHVKSSAPFGIKNSYPIENGLAEYFKDILGKGPE